MGFWPIRARARSYLYYKIKYVYCIWLVCFSKLDFFERCGKWRLAGIDPCINIIHPANEFILLSIKNKLCIWIFFIEWLQSLLCSDKNRENSLSIVTKRYFWKDRLIHGCILYKRLTNKKSTLFTFHTENAFPFIYDAK